MGLKYVRKLFYKLEQTRFNRTIVGLKYFIFQAYHRRIKSFNRTIVGLKLKVIDDDRILGSVLIEPLWD